ncbi:MAG: hypothetical protein IKI31_01055, partial [Treponema sp.]|nr:hypothetical protein [Treponema sp.]
PKVPSKIDRTISHTISWQSIEVLPGNPVESFTLPSKPDFSITKATDGALTVSVEESEGYAFCVEDSSSLFKSTIADTFWGDEVFGELKLSVYYNSVFQGFEYVPFSVDKKRPSSPVIASSSEHFFSRQPVSLNISGDESAQLFVAISEPLIVLGNVSNTETIELFNSVEAKDFAPSSNTLILDSNETEAVFFKVVSYYVDKSGNKSDESVYGVLIDKHNYFVDSSNTHSSPDGSEENPFTSFEQCLEVLKNVSFMNINLSGHIVMPKGETSLYSNCRIKGNKDGRLIFPHASSLAVRSATLEVIDCVLERLDREAEESVNVFIKLEHALLSFQNCEVSVLFSSNGTAIQSTSSSVMIKESGLSSSTPSYSSCISAVDSKLNITSSRLSSAGSTVVNISAQGSELELSSTNCKLTGTFGRAVELFSSKSVLKDNVFFAELTNSNGKDDALFVDARTLSLEYSGNTIRGF